MYWQQWYPQWTIPKGYHIKPGCICKEQGMTDEQINHPRNLIVLHPDDHQTIHRLRGDISVRNNRLGVLASEETKQKMRESAKFRPTQSIKTRKKNHNR